MYACILFIIYYRVSDQSQVSLCGFPCGRRGWAGGILLWISTGRSLMGSDLLAVVGAAQWSVA